MTLFVTLLILGRFPQASDHVGHDLWKKWDTNRETPHFGFGVVCFLFRSACVRGDLRTRFFLAIFNLRVRLDWLGARSVVGHRARPAISLLGFLLHSSAFPVMGSLVFANLLHVSFSPAPESPSFHGNGYGSANPVCGDPPLQCNPVNVR